MEILTLLLLILLVAYICFSNYKRKINTLNKINNEFGEKPNNFSEDFDMNFVKNIIKHVKNMKTLVNQLMS